MESRGNSYTKPKRIISGVAEFNAGRERQETLKKCVKLKGGKTPPKKTDGITHSKGSRTTLDNFGL